MKIAKMLGSTLTLSLVATSFSFFAASVAQANVKLENYQCPTEFEGTVSKIEEVSKKDHSMAKIKVTFKNERPIRGSDFNEKTVTMLKHGMQQVYPGELYSVEMRNNRICDVRAI